jgi:iron-sulfur cluster assembly protein
VGVGEKKMISVSPKAFNEIKRLNTESKSLRIAVQGGGCSGLIYKLSFDEPKQGDKILQCDDAIIVIDSKSALFLRGLLLDFSDGLNGTGFTFTNPNATKSCGCGTSFAV